MALINVVQVQVESKGKYTIAKVKYTMSGREYSKNVVSFGDQAEVYKILTSNPTPQAYETVEDDTKYKNWTSVKPVASQSAGTSSTMGSSNPSPKSNYETSEERAARQVYIIRQSSLERAIELFTLNGNKKADAFEVMSLADTFAEYVQNGLEQAAIKSGGLPVGDVASKLAELESDKPWE